MHFCRYARDNQCVESNRVASDCDNTLHRLRRAAVLAARPRRHLPGALAKLHRRRRWRILGMCKFIIHNKFWLICLQKIDEYVKVRCLKFNSRGVPIISVIIYYFRLLYVYHIIWWQVKQKPCHTNLNPKSWNSLLNISFLLQSN